MNYCNCPNCLTANCPAATEEESRAHELERSKELVKQLTEAMLALRRLVWEHHSDDILKDGIVVCPACVNDAGQSAMAEVDRLLKLLESNSKPKQPNAERLQGIIRRAKSQFCYDGTDGEIAAKMFAILCEE